MKVTQCTVALLFVVLSTIQYAKAATVSLPLLDVAVSAHGNQLQQEIGTSEVSLSEEPVAILLDEGEVVFFDASASLDPALAASLFWEWTVELNGQLLFLDTSGPTLQITVPDQGIYTVTTTVSDSTGASAFQIIELRVYNVDPILTEINAPDFVAMNGSSYKVTGHVEDPGNDQVQVRVAFGDGSFSFPAIKNDGSFEALHEYLESGEYDVFVEAIDEDGGYSTSTLSVTVLRAEAPRVKQVLVGSRMWRAPFLAHLTDTNQGNMYGYAVPRDGKQTLPLPWTNIHRISIVFSGDVQVAESDLKVTGARGKNYAFFPDSFYYDESNHTAMWSLASFVGSERLKLQLVDSVTDEHGTALDGEWSTGLGADSSGNGIPGSDFIFQMNILPGDVDQYRSVLGNDILRVRRAQFSRAGDARYHAFADVDGSGLILGDDLILVRNLQLMGLP